MRTGVFRVVVQVLLKLVLALFVMNDDSFDLFEPLVNVLPVVFCLILVVNDLVLYLIMLRLREYSEDLVLEVLLLNHPSNQWTGIAAIVSVLYAVLIVVCYPIAIVGYRANRHLIRTEVFHVDLVK